MVTVAGFTPRAGRMSDAQNSSHRATVVDGAVGTCPAATWACSARSFSMQVFRFFDVTRFILRVPSGPAGISTPPTHMPSLRL